MKKKLNNLLLTPFDGISLNKGERKHAKALRTQIKDYLEEVDRIEKATMSTEEQKQEQLKPIQEAIAREEIPADVEKADMDEKSWLWYQVTELERKDTVYEDKSDVKKIAKLKDKANDYYQETLMRKAKGAFQDVRDAELDAIAAYLAAGNFDEPYEIQNMDAFTNLCGLMSWLKTDIDCKTKDGTAVVVPGGTTVVDTGG